MAKYLASEYGKEVAEDAFRIHGGYGFSKEYEIERLYREVPMLLIGEGTAEIQKMIVGRRLLEKTRPPVTAGTTLFSRTLGQFDEGAWTELLLFLFLTALTGAVALIEARRLGLSRHMLATPTTPQR
jgi:Acyl-CoA dehydrogenase, C-terminal domain